MSLIGRHLLEPCDLTIEETELLFDLAERVIAAPADFADRCRGRLLATLFYEPSTRTRLSFEAAMLRLGGAYLGFSHAASSSVSKGESVADTIRMAAAYADICVMRHPKEGAPRVASQYSTIPVINAGDGGHHHPTQTLTDLMTIRHQKRTFDDLKIGVCGDLKFGRTAHSLIRSLSRYNVRFVMIAPEELSLPKYVVELLKQSERPFTTTTDLSAAIEDIDVLYMTRVQKERFFNEQDYVRLKDSYILDADKLNGAKKDLMILHPLPRVNEIAADVDNDKRAFYFKQAENGMYIRMALIMSLLGVN